METVVVTMTEIISSVTEVVTAAFGWMGTALAEITSEPVLLLFCVAIPLVGLGIGLVKRLISVN